MWRPTLLLGGGLALLGFQEPLFDLGFTSEDHSTRAGEYFKSTLSDNSVIEINTNSALSVDFTPRHRSVSLTGWTRTLMREWVTPALFPSLRATSPFRRSTPYFPCAGNRKMRSVCPYPRVLMRQSLRERWSIRRFVMEGTIGGGHTGRLQAGALILDPFSTVDSDCQWALRRGQICLTGESLTEAVAAINRYAQQQWVIGDPSLASARVGGLFDVATYRALQAHSSADWGLWPCPEIQSRSC